VRKAVAPPNRLRYTSAVDSALVERVTQLIVEHFGAGTSVRRVTALAGDASTRRYLRASLTGPGAPASVVVMLLADRGIAISSEELAVFKTAPTELPYVNVHRFLVGLGVAVPELYLDASSTGVLLLEDIGDVPLWDAVRQQPADVVCELYQRAIDQLLLIEIAGTARRDEACVAFQQTFDERLFNWEFEHFIEWGLLKRLDHAPSDGDLRVMREHFAAISRFLDAQPRVLNHRDFHSWNLYVHDGGIRVIDFQDALLAPGPYDLATLLGDRDTPTLITPPLEQRLLQYYRAQWQAHGGAPWTEESLWDVYASCALQKAFKVVGRFHYLHLEKGKPGYLRFLPSTLRQIGRLLDRRPDLTPLREVLVRYLPELRS
jgi:aminoglycoside/choline kinase family phosphotransferase